MTNKFPEANSGSALDFAPAEGKIPTSILKDKNWDINSFPNLHPTGQNKMFQERKINLTPQQYLGQRLNKHKICAKVRKIIQSQDFLRQFLKVAQYLKVSILFLTSPDYS